MDFARSAGHRLTRAHMIPRGTATNDQDDHDIDGARLVMTVEDLDCQCILDELQVSGERFKEARRALPFVLSADELNHMQTKAAAKWSLGGNAQQHDLVLETCEDELNVRTNRSKLALLEIVARAYLFCDDYTCAAERITEYVRLNPRGVRAFSRDEPKITMLGGSFSLVS